MIRLEFLAYAINVELGLDKYVVYLNSNAYPDDIGDRNVVTLNATRIPFGFSQEELNAESMTLMLTFDLPCDASGTDVIIRDGALANIQAKLLGHKVFTVECPDGNYIVNAYLEQQPPANPYIDSGRITQQIVLSGSALIQSEKCGAIVGNDIKVSIGDGTKYDDSDYVIVDSDGVVKGLNTLLKVSRVSNVSIGADNNIPLSDNKVIPEVLAISKTATKTLSFLYLGKTIEKNFLKMAEGVPVYDINHEFTYKVDYGDFAVTVPIIILEISLEDAAAKYLQYTLTVQIVGDAEVT